MRPGRPSAEGRGAADGRPPVRIGICDDDPVAAGRLGGHLCAAGFEVQEPLSSVGQAMGWLSVDPPDVLLLDLDLPAGGGLDLLGWLRAQRLLDRVQVLVLTGGDDAGSLDRARQLGARGGLAKPVEGARLVAEVRRLLAEPPGAWIGDPAPPAAADASPRAGEDARPRAPADGLERLNPVVAELSRTFGRETVARLLRSLLDQLARMEEAARGRADPQDAAHATRGAAANLGFEAVSDACGELEAAVRAGADLAPARRRTAEACARVREAIADGLSLAA